MTWLLPTLFIVAAPPLGGFLGETAFRSAPSLAMVAGILLTIFELRKMTLEVSSITKTPIAWWPIIVPLYGLYWSAVALPAEVAKAKSAAGKGAPRGAVVYLFLCLYALASDLNDLAEA